MLYQEIGKDTRFIVTINIACGITVIQSAINAEKIPKPTNIVFLANILSYLMHSMKYVACNWVFA